MAKAKKTDIAVVDPATEIIDPKEFMNGMSKEVIQQKGDRFRMLVTSIKSAALNQAVALQEIYNEKLYALAEYTSFDEFASTELPFVGTQKAKQYALMMNAVGNSKKLAGLINEKGGLDLLIEASRDLQLNQYQGELSDEVAAILEDRISAMRQEVKGLNEKLKKKDQLLKTQKQNTGDLEEALYNLKQDHERILNAMAKEKGLSPEEIKRITTKNEAILEIAELETAVTRLHARIAHIDHEIRDSELASAVERSIQHLHSSAKRIESEWAPQLDENSSLSLVPGEEN